MSLSILFPSSPIASANPPAVVSVAVEHYALLLIGQARHGGEDLVQLKDDELELVEVGVLLLVGHDLACIVAAVIETAD